MNTTDTNQATPDPIAQAVAEFVDSFSGFDVAGDVAARLNCGEVDALAGLLRAAGCEEAADLWIAEHATDDDEGDAHYITEGTGR